MNEYQYSRLLDDIRRIVREEISNRPTAARKWDTCEFVIPARGTSAAPGLGVSDLYKSSTFPSEPT